MAIKEEKIRIQLKAYDYQLLDQSTLEIVETARRTGARNRRDRFRFQPKLAVIAFFDRLTWTKNPANISKFVRINA
jgi:hypothetical protein